MRHLLLLLILSFFSYAQPSQFLAQVYSSSSIGKVDIKKSTTTPFGEFVIVGEYDTDVQIENSVSMSPYHGNYMMKIDANGNHEWTLTFGNKSYLFVEGLEVGDDGSIFLSGNFRDSISIQNYSRVENGFQPFLWKISPSGNFEFAFPYRSNPNVVCRPRISAANGELTVSIIASDSLTYSSNTLLPSYSNTVGLLARYNYQGNLILSKTIESPDQYFAFAPNRISDNRIVMQVWANNTDSIYFGQNYFAGNNKKGNWFFELDSTFTVTKSNFIEYTRSAGFSYNGVSASGDLLYTGSFSGTVTDGNLSITNQDEPGNSIGLQDGLFMVLDDNLQLTTLEAIGALGENESITGAIQLGEHYFLCGKGKGDLLFKGDTILKNDFAQGFVLELDKTGNYKSLIETENNSPIANTSFLSISINGSNSYAVVGTSTVSAVFNKTDTLNRQCLLDGFIWTNTDNTISLPDLESFEKICYFYPNPASQLIRIEAPNLSNNSQLLNIRVFDLTGTVVLSQKLTSSTIDISTLKNGLYIFELEGAQPEQRFLQRIVIR